MRRSIVFAFILTLFLKFNNVLAQESQLSFSGYVDGYYSFDFSKPMGNERLYVSQYDRHNEFNINHAWLKGSYTSTKIRANLALQAGTYPIRNYAAEPEELYRMIYEANAGYRVSEKSWFDIGVFSGHFGFESVLALDRELYSPALATEYTPYYQTGARYSYTFSESTVLRAVILNGWQNIAETNNGKSFGIALEHRLSETFFIGYGNYYGNESTDPGEKIMRFHNNLVVTVTPLTNLSMTGVADMTVQEGSTVLFLTSVNSYKVTANWSLAGRYEYVRDSDRILVVGELAPFDVHVISLSLNYQPAADVALKLEGKTYKGKGDNFIGDLGVGSGSIVVNGGLIVRINQK